MSPKTGCLVGFLKPQFPSTISNSSTHSLGPCFLLFSLIYCSEDLTWVSLEVRSHRIKLLKCQQSKTGMMVNAVWSHHTETCGPWSHLCELNEYSLCPPSSKLQHSLYMHLWCKAPFSLYTIDVVLGSQFSRFYLVFCNRHFWDCWRREFCLFSCMGSFIFLWRELDLTFMQD